MHNQLDPAQIARTNMVESQLRPNRVHNPDLLEAMLNLPREAFLPADLKPLAYNDAALRIATDRFMTEPLIASRMIEAAAITATSRVLVIGAANGYLPAIVSRMASAVVAVEPNEILSQLGIQGMAQLNISNVEWRSGALEQGSGGDGSFDSIIIDGAVANVPEAILDQLVQGGRLVTILCETRSGGPGVISHGVVIERVGTVFSIRRVFDGFAAYLPGFAPKEAFHFA